MKMLINYKLSCETTVFAAVGHRLLGTARRFFARGLIVLTVFGLGAQITRAQALITATSAPTTAGITTGGGNFATGQSVTVSATANTGYYFVNWTEGPNQAVVSTAPNYTFSVSAAPIKPSRDLVANFAPVTTSAKITITGQAQFFGTFTGAGTYPIGASVTVTAPANLNGTAGFTTFIGWSERGVVVSTSSSYTFVVAGPRTLELMYKHTDPLSVSISSGSEQVLLPGDSLNNIFALAWGGTPPYKYHWTFENSTSFSQSDEPLVGRLTYAEASSTGADVYYPTLPYVGPNNYISVTATDAVGASTTKRTRIAVLPLLLGDVIALPGLRAYRAPEAIPTQGVAPYGFFPADYNPRFTVYVPSSYNPQIPMPALFDENGDLALRNYADSIQYVHVTVNNFIFESDPTNFHARMDLHELALVSISNRLFRGMNIDRQHVMLTGVSRNGYPSWFAGAKRSEIFTELGFQSSNFYRDSELDSRWVSVPTWKTRPICLIWGENDRPNMIDENVAASDFLRNVVKVQKLTQNVVPGGGHGAYPNQLIAWWDEIIPKTVSTRSISPTGGTTTGAGRFSKGASATVNATPATGYSFVNWTANGAPVSTAASYTFTVSVPIELTANFQASAPTPDTTAPSMPINLIGTAAGTTTINLTWTASTDNVGVTGYRIYRGGTEVGSSTTTTYSDTGLNAGTAYNYTVAARDAAGNTSTRSIAVNVTTTVAPPPPPVPDTTAPTVPANLSGTAASTTSINLTWTASTDNVGVTSYRIFRGGTEVGSSTTTNYSDTGLNAGTTYSYTVTARDAAGNTSTRSIAVNVTTTAAPPPPPVPDTTAPTVPSNLSGTTASTTTINLTWTASTDNVGVTSYRIYRGGAEVGSSATTNYSDTGLTAGTTYSYTVAARDAAGNTSTRSTAVNVTTTAAPPPPPVPDTTAPTVPSNLSGTAASTTTINLTWTASTDNVGVTSYRIFRGGTEVGNSATTNYSDTGLTAGTTYSYTVAARDAAGNISLQSTAAVVKTSATPVVVPTSTPSRIINLSTRSYVGQGSDILIAGFIISGSGPKTVLLRASGPGLLKFGVPGFLSDPILDLHSGSTIISSNNDWGSDPIKKAAILSAAQTAGAFGWDDGSKDAAILTTLDPGPYTVTLTGANGSTGVALIEAYEIDTANHNSRLSNISSRALVKTGADVQIAGFIVTGAAPKKVIIRASGPALSKYNVPGVLADPMLVIYSNQTAIATNDDWAPALRPDFQNAGIDNWDIGSKDAAVVMSLNPGAYTAIVSGKADTQGVALIEVFEADGP